MRSGEVSPWALVRVVVMLRIGDGRWEFRSGPLDPVMAEILTRTLAAEPLVHVLSSHIEPVADNDTPGSR